MVEELVYPFQGNVIRQKKKSLRRQLLEPGGLAEKKIAILSGSTIGEIKPILELFLLNQGIRPIFWEGNYNRYYEDVLFDTGELEAFSPDFVYIHTTVRNIQRFPEITDSQEAVEKLYKQTLEHFKELWEKIEEKLHCPVIQNNLEMFPWRVMGNMDCVSENGMLNFIERLNQGFYEYIRNHGHIYINDLHYLSASYGLDRWFDSGVWYAYKYAFSLDAIPMVCHSIANLIKSICGKNKKALVVDLDHTLWGGVIGETGVDGIKLGPESPEGMPYEEFQRYLKRLSELGVPLAVCSKNEEEAARDGFRHPASILKEKDFSAFYANWEEKSHNLEEIGRKLNLLPDSLVFADDNPAEQEQVRAALDGIAVLPLKNPEDYVKILDRSGYFEVTGLSEEDKKRNEYYRGNAERERERSSYSSYGEYLKGLKMEACITAIGNKNLDRALQLINKTNQFNTTGRRYTEEEVKDFLDRDITLCGSLSDKFGDNGIISVMLVKILEKQAHIDLWVMSCRVFKRDMELAMFDELVLQCRNRGLERIQAWYQKTKKNKPIEALYSQLGFTLIKSQPDGAESVWEYEIPKNYMPKNQVIKIEGSQVNER